MSCRTLRLHRQTSSAVVGFSGRVIKQPAAGRTAPWRSSPRCSNSPRPTDGETSPEWPRYCGSPPARAGPAASARATPLRCARCARIVSTNLVPDGKKRIKGRHGVLKDHARRAAAQFCQFLRAGPASNRCPQAAVGLPPPRQAARATAPSPHPRHRLPDPSRPPPRSSPRDRAPATTPRNGPDAAVHLREGQAEVLRSRHRAVPGVSFMGRAYTAFEALPTPAAWEKDHRRGRRWTVRT